MVGKKEQKQQVPLRHSIVHHNDAASTKSKKNAALKAA
jgi:hypothetical protein